MGEYDTAESPRQGAGGKFDEMLRALVSAPTIGDLRSVYRRAKRYSGVMTDAQRTVLTAAWAKRWNRLQGIAPAPKLASGRRSVA